MKIDIAINVYTYASSFECTAWKIKYSSSFGKKGILVSKNHNFKLEKPTAVLILRVRIIGRKNTMPMVYQSIILFVN